jgi:hypothetical protein
MYRYVKLIGKTNKGKNRINEAGRPTKWTVVEERQSIVFSDKPGPWLHVFPYTQQGAKDSRWVHISDDVDFEVEFI